MKKILFLLLLLLPLYASNIHKAKVIETLNSGGYSYIKVAEGDQKYWIAMTQRKVNIGDTIEFQEQGWMKNFHSKTLGRTFEKILFASDTSHKEHTQQVQNRKPDIMHSQYQKQGTLNIAQLVKNRASYKNATVTIRAKVTKVSQAIMKRNWVHLQDGSRFSNIDDIVFTTKNTPPKVGNIVYASGKVAIDKDFGYGYFYPVIVENATFRK